MSGPKHSTFDIRENELRLERERAAALSETARLQGEVQTLLARLEGVSPDAAMLLNDELEKLQRTAVGASHADLIARPERMRDLFERISGSLGRSEARRRGEDEMRKRLGEGNAEVHRVAADRAARMQAIQDRWLIPMVEIIAELRVSADPAETERLDRIEALARDPATARESLSFDVTAIQSAIAERAGAAREAAVLRVRLSGHGDPEAASVIGELEQVEAGRMKLDADLRVRAKQEIVRLERDEDRKYVAQVLADGFRELGYAIDEDFVTAFERGEAIEIGRPDDRTYAAQLKFDRESLEVGSELVAVADRSHMTSEAIAHDDRSAEQAWCGDFARVLGQARAQGIEGRTKPARLIGHAPVRSVAGRSAGQVAGKVATHSANQMQRMLKP